ncbi:hypothetical protein ACO0K9_05135 [Undibacterium sp. Ji50W]|uniref:hypothetical protein n=1 Tax=Undibacterium TaxID=401469 RepID=UPI003BEFA60D
MNIVKKTNLTVLTIAVFAATIVPVAKYINKLNASNHVATVTISAPRLTEQQKIAFDLEQAGNKVHTVFIAAKRLSNDEKLAFDQQDRQIQQAKMRTHKKPQLLV